jgi:hypothetical protein
MVSTLLHDTCLNKKFSIVFYVVEDSTYAWGGNLQPTHLTSCVTNLNNAFKRICVQFLNCSTVVIPNYTYNNWTQTITDPVVTSNWRTDKTLCIYLVDNAPGNGYTYFPNQGPGKDYIVLNKSVLVNQTTKLYHEMGHFFGLPNTYDEIGSVTTPTPPPGVASYEFFRRTNCYANGDGFCDTEADCYPVGNTSVGPCGHQPGTQDGFLDFYVPPVDNYMSEWICRCKYSQEQYNFMARVILNQKLYLH